MRMPATRTARNPDPWATVAAPKMTSKPARTRGEYRPSLGSGTRRMNASSASPPATPTATPIVICSRNSATTYHATLAALPCAASSAASSAMPTGSLAPDSPSSRTPVRPPTPPLPNTENTTAGSVAATAVPTSRARCQLIPATYRAATAVPAAVTSVPAVPVHTIAPAAVRNRRRPMCIPPSNKMTASATVTTRVTVVTGSVVTAGQSCAAMTAAMRKNAGAGTRSLALSRLESTAAVPARPITRTMRPNWLVPLISQGLYPLGTRSAVNRAARLAPPGLRLTQELDEENWAKLKNDDGSSMLDTLNRDLSTPNWYMTSATRWIRVASTPIG